MKDHKANPRLHKLGAPSNPETGGKITAALLPALHNLQAALGREVTSAEKLKIFAAVFTTYRDFGWEAAKRKFTAGCQRLLDDAAVGRICR